MCGLASASNPFSAQVKHALASTSSLGDSFAHLANPLQGQTWSGQGCAALIQNLGFCWNFIHTTLQVEDVTLPSLGARASNSHSTAGPDPAVSQTFSNVQCTAVEQASRSTPEVVPDVSPACFHGLYTFELEMELC